MPAGSLKECQQGPRSALLSVFPKSHGSCNAGAYFQTCNVIASNMCLTKFQHNVMLGKAAEAPKHVVGFVIAVGAIAAIHCYYDSCCCHHHSCCCRRRRCRRRGRHRGCRGCRGSSCCGRFCCYSILLSSLYFCCCSFRSCFLLLVIGFLCLLLLLLLVLVIVLFLFLCLLLFLFFFF